MSGFSARLRSNRRIGRRGRQGGNRWLLRFDARRARALCSTNKRHADDEKNCASPPRIQLQDIPPATRSRAALRKRFTAWSSKRSSYGQTLGSTTIRAIFVRRLGFVQPCPFQKRLKLPSAAAFFRAALARLVEIVVDSAGLSLSGPNAQFASLRVDDTGRVKVCLSLARELFRSAGSRHASSSNLWLKFVVDDVRHAEAAVDGWGAGRDARRLERAVDGLFPKNRSRRSEGSNPARTLISE
jgi:hypothetical protein